MRSQPVHGILNIYKPTGVTSRDVVNQVGRSLGTRKVGHAGTLDPLASGVLVICVGAATRLVERIQEHPKGYRAGVTLGVRSDTDDSTGTVVPGSDPSGISRAELETVLREFVGEIDQKPPKFSAVHVNGQRAYELARENREFELTERKVRVDEARLLSFDNPKLEFDVVCGSGTYIRSIIRDLGDRFGCGAIMTSLHRTFVGPFQDSTAISLNADVTVPLSEQVQPLKSVLGESDPRFHATDEECQALRKGQGLEIPEALLKHPDERVAVLDSSGELFAFAKLDRTHGRILPQRVFVR